MMESRAGVAVNLNVLTTLMGSCGDREMELEGS